MDPTMIIHTTKMCKGTLYQRTPWRKTDDIELENRRWWNLESV